MDSDKLSATIRVFKQRSPYHPFTLVLNNGTRLEADHPEAVSYRAGTGVHLGPMGVPTLFEADGVTEVVGDLARPDGRGNREPAAA